MLKFAKTFYNNGGSISPITRIISPFSLGIVCELFCLDFSGKVTKCSNVVEHDDGGQLTSSLFAIIRLLIFSFSKQIFSRLFYSKYDKFVYQNIHQFQNVFH